MSKTQKSPKIYHHLQKLGVGLKEPKNAHDMYNLLMNMKPNQLMVAKHIVHQAQGGKPTHFHPRYEHELEKKHIQAFKRSGAIKHFQSGHKLAEFYRLHHEKGGGFASAVTTGLKAVVNGVKKVGKTALKYAKIGAEWAIKNPDKLKQIIEGVTTGVDIIKTMTKKEEDKIDFDKDPFTTDDEKDPDRQKAGSLNFVPKQISKKSKTNKYLL